MIDDKIKNFLELTSEICYKTTEIFIGNPFDLIEMDMSKIPSNCFFISDYHVNKGEMLKLNDGEIKRDAYKFIKEFPDRVFRGEM